MKIQVSDLEPNPFRRMKHYPLDRDKIDRLKISIKETSFWDNVLVRPHPTEKGKYQIAYGHHRLVSLQELKITEVDVPVKDLDDATMIRIMANENLEWSSAPIIINETVLVAKKFLDKELAKYKTWEEAEKVSIFTNLFTGWDPIKKRDIPNPKAAFGQAKGQGVGQTTICKFLGGNWKQWMVREALDTLGYGEKDKKTGKLKKKPVSREAVEMIKTSHQATKFKEAVRTFDVPEEEQKEIAKKITKNHIGSRDIYKTVLKHKKEKQHSVVRTEVQKLEKTYETIDSDMLTLSNKIIGFLVKLNDLGIKELQGETHFLGLMQIRTLVKTLERLYTFGTKTQNKQKQITGASNEQ